MRHFMLLLLACSAALTTLGAQPASKGGSKPPAPTAVPLIVTVNNTQTYPPSGPGTVQSNVQSDGRGSYTDGTEGVCATLDTSGQLHVDLQCNSAANPRVLYLFGVSPVALAPPTNGSYSCTVPNLANTAHLNHFQGVPATDLASPAFQNMTVDATGNTVYLIQVMIASKLLNDPSQTAFRVNYHGTQSFSDGLKSSYAQVRRLSATQWNVEPAAPSALPGNPINAGMLVHETTVKNRTTITECGFYQVPFSFTLTAK
ncbi:MAG: hypothetical protein ABI811_20425 [Acidobacteriota bacterium]